MENPNPEQIAGIKTATLIAAFIGSAVALSYQKEMTPWQVFTSFIAGAAVSVYATPLLLAYFSIDAGFERAIAFFAGLVAMRCVPIIYSLVDKLKDVKLPWFGDKE